jgi:Glycosyl transferase family 11
MLVVASKPGQLGNRLFQFASLVGGAREHGFRVANPAFDEYAELFEATRRDLFCRYPPRASFVRGGARLRRLLYLLCYYAARALVRLRVDAERLRAVALDWDERLELSDPTFLSRVRPGQLFFLQGWLIRDERAVERHAGAIREFLRPRAEFVENVSSLVGRARGEADILVGVHIRHGDYRTYQGGKYFYGLDAYAALMKAAEELFAGRRVRFLVCSNAEHDAETFARFRHTRGTGHVVEDLYALARCDYLLGPPSTFSMWASFYGDVPLYTVEDPQRRPRLEDFAVYGSRPPALAPAP